MAEQYLEKYALSDSPRVSPIPDTDPRKPDIPPSIYIICIAACALGKLWGEWIDATHDIDTINEKINAMLSRSPVHNAGEWAIYAYDGFASLKLTKEDSLEAIHYKAVFIETYGKWSAKLLEHFDCDYEQAEEAIVEHYMGKFASQLAFVLKLLSDKIPDFIKKYIDYESFQQDIFTRDYYAIEVGGEIHVFSRRACS